ncbi:hypothetical protein SFRURICE_005680 [Spodoptera frugiperda]|nr:hypothetical protein SFRURICE_005680 [Spodoptera frugiperda]
MKTWCRVLVRNSDIVIPVPFSLVLLCQTLSRVSTSCTLTSMGLGLDLPVKLPIRNSVDQQHLSAASHLQCIHITGKEFHLPLQTLKRIPGVENPPALNAQ